MFLLDTTALSELTKRRPNDGFLHWMSAQSAQDGYIGAPSIGELEIGIALLKPSKKRRSLESWIQHLVEEFDERILPFDLAAARIWGRAVAAARHRGKTLPATDAQIAAIASFRGLPVVTRNVRHFKVAGFEELMVIDPWSSTQGIS
ncbi:MAG: type II toxin-antitoxin system VapC family toxin [Candidatus Eremiobacteraeota bacterium]|nr:type II toxin-antitoxin system VapC family toxin [Candidatus Eremiobacteraeota bacterium]MBC5803856.1 type II toxin-antitoxin system VapC family toxin [Candidatus Eremiobacteraeota bacterium]MBC5822986.1 type II toxin-antitoxin system VapC family toxin [Candidatus Eremiobacteraeota bacterium]